MLDVVSVVVCTVVSSENETNSPSALVVPMDSGISVSFSRDDVPGNLRGGKGGGVRCMSLDVCEGDSDNGISASDPVAFPDT